MIKIDNIALIKDLISLEQELDLRINNFIIEYGLRRGVDKEDIKRLRESLDYVLDERFRFIALTMERN